MKNFINVLRLFLLTFSNLTFAYSFSFYLFINCNNSKYITSAKALEESKIVYAKANENCILYKDETLSDNVANIYFYVPESYFVSIISKVNENVYRVLYDNYSGYCKSADLTIANFTPNVCTLSGITFDIKETAGTQLWSSPTDQGGKVYSMISASSKKIDYIASTVGEIPIGGTSNIWYYARYTPSTNTTAVYEGYIYSEATTNLSHIPTNLECNNEEIIPTAPQTINLNTSLKIVFILLISLPFIILFVIACIKARKTLKKHPRQEEASLANTSSSPVKPIRKISGNFTKKKPIQNEILEDDTIEVVFPEYNFVDDDDLL